MLTVLVVDDAATDRVRAGGIAAKWLGCSVLEAVNGRDAMQQIGTHHPDLVLTDLHMPEMSGLQLVAAVREEYPHIPVVLMTAQGSEEIASQALRAGAASYVPKHSLADDLLPTLNQVYGTAQDEQSPSYLMHYVVGTVTEFSLPNDPKLIRACVNHLLSLLRCLPLGDVTERLRTGIALKEAIDNAMYHGNLEVTTAVTGDMPKGVAHSRFDQIAAVRMHEPPYVSRRIHVSADISRERAQFVVSHDGPGIDAATFDNGIAGRGITLMRSIMDEVSYSTAGDSVTMIRLAVQNDDLCDDDYDDEDD